MGHKEWLAQAEADRGTKIRCAREFGQAIARHRQGAALECAQCEIWSLSMRFALFAAAAVMSVASMATAVQAERLTDAPLVDAGWLEQHLGNEGLVVLDVRDPVGNVAAYDSAHIPGAIRAPVGWSAWGGKMGAASGGSPGWEPTSAWFGRWAIANTDKACLWRRGPSSSHCAPAPPVSWTSRWLANTAVWSPGAGP